MTDARDGQTIAAQAGRAIPRATSA